MWKRRTFVGWAFSISITKCHPFLFECRVSRRVSSHVNLQAKCHYRRGTLSTNGWIQSGGGGINMRIIMLANYLVLDPAFYGDARTARRRNQPQPAGSAGRIDLSSAGFSGHCGSTAPGSPLLDRRGASLTRIGPPSHTSATRPECVWSAPARHCSAGEGASQTRFIADRPDARAMRGGILRGVEREGV